MSSKAAYAIYRPEIRGIPSLPDPYTYREAMKHYRKQPESDNIEAHVKNMKTRKNVIARTNR